MSGRERREEFLAKAQEAQDQADKAKDAFAKNSWLKIAENYRDLARGEDAN